MLLMFTDWPIISAARPVPRESSPQGGLWPQRGSQARGCDRCHHFLHYHSTSELIFLWLDYWWFLLTVKRSLAAVVSLAHSHLSPKRASSDGPMQFWRKTLKSIIRAIIFQFFWDALLNNYASSSVSEMSIIIIERHGKQRVQPVFFLN